MTKSDKDLDLAEQYDKKAQEHIKKVLEWGQSAINATNPAERKNALKSQEKNEKLQSMRSQTRILHCGCEQS